MADLEAIRRGLAANLRDALIGSKGHVSPYMKDAPSVPAIQIVGLAEFDYHTLGFGSRQETYLLLVEALFGRVSDVGAWRLLDGLLSGNNAFQIAAESDQLLTSRLNDDGTVTTGHDPAASSVTVRHYRGQSVDVTLPDGTKVLAASWEIEAVA